MCSLQCLRQVVTHTYHEGYFAAPSLRARFVSWNSRNASPAIASGVMLSIEHEFCLTMYALQVERPRVHMPCEPSRVGKCLIETRQTDLNLSVNGLLDQFSSSNGIVG